jgi:beta-lactamase superfamily II metal-dependent hydrolase
MNDIYKKYRHDKDAEKNKNNFYFFINIVLLICVVIFSAFNFYRYIQLIKDKEEIEIIIEKKLPFEVGTNELLITFIDVQQGDAILIETPNGKKILIDAGEGLDPDFKFAKKVNAGKKRVLPYLRQRKIEHLDYLISTHPHSDHIGGMLYLLKYIKVNKFIDSGFAYSSVLYSKLLKTIKKKNIKYQIVKPDDELFFGDEIYCKVIYANARPDDVNNASVTLYLKYKNKSFMLTGDLEANREKEVCKNYGYKIKSDVLKLGHHGSKTSTSKLWLKCVEPEYAVICVGKKNKFRHPSDVILDRLDYFNVSKIYRTDLDGNIYFLTDGNKIRVITQKQRKSKK